MSNIGIMDPAFFVGKNILINWLNETFEANITKIEQMCTGAIACQILDAIYPGKVQLHKVNFDAKTEPEYVSNFKVLQAVFDSEGIIKHIDVPKLIKGKYMDNLEFTQWLKQYFDKNYGGQPYNAKERRDQARAAYSSKRGHRTPTTSSSSTVTKPKSSTNTPRVVSTTTSTTTTTVVAKKKPTTTATSAAKRVGSGGNASSSANEAIADLTSQLNELRVSSEGLDKERTFYFEKLRRIEILCQDEAEVSLQDFKKEVLQILYETDENQEFQPPEEGVDEAAKDGLLDDAELADTTF